MNEERPGIELGTQWTIGELVALARGEAVLHFGAEARARVEASHSYVAALAAAGVDGPNVYGVNTGFGAFAETRIAPDQIRMLQHNLLRSHACGVGPALGNEQVRALIALRAQVLALGHSGVRPKVIEQLVEMHSREVIPRVPSQGSVGASGDLAPLAHLALVLIGEGEASVDGEMTDGAAALREAGLEPLALEAKEGLALINGTQLMLAIGGLALAEAQELVRLSDIVGAMSLEALQGSSRPFDERIQAVRPHPGQAASANNLRMLLRESEIIESHRDCKKVQDPYSLRCMPQVHGASRDVIRFARGVIERELIAATDNPLIFVGEEQTEVISGGNFHGQPLALALDAATMAVAELANLAERRIEQLVNPAMSSDLPAFLAPRTGLDSGFMMAQVTAAALVSENKVLAHPSSVDSIPSSAGKEDHVSMGTISARKLQQVATHVRTVLAIEALVASQGLEHRKPMTPGKGVATAYEFVREHVTALEADHALYTDIDTLTHLLPTLLHRVEETHGVLD